jgi:tRNA1Val (adenine37-N6)-methyltransferase
MSFADEGLTLDRLLGGRLDLWQPRSGYRAATDPVLLAAAVQARPGQSVLELGCGAGAGLLALGLRVRDLGLTGVERQPAYAELARRNAARNGLPARIACADLARLPAELRLAFDHVLMNPPWFDPTDPAAADPGRDTAQREETPLADWLSVGLARLAPGGWLSVIHRAARLPDLLSGLSGRAGAVAVRPLIPRAGRPAGRVIVQARKGARGPFRLLAPLILHESPAHPGDRDDFSPAAQAILRDMAALGWD